VDIVDIFRRSEHVPEIVEEAIRIGAKMVWMQEGVIHEDAAQAALAAGLEVVMDRCILKEHRRLARADRQLWPACPRERLESPRPATRSTSAPGQEVLDDRESRLRTPEVAPAVFRY